MVIRMKRNERSLARGLSRAMAAVMLASILMMSVACTRGGMSDMNGDNGTVQESATTPMTPEAATR